MTIKVFYIEENENNSNQFEIDDDKSKKEIVKSVDFCIKTTNFNHRQQQQQQQKQKNTVDEHKSSIAFSENYFKVKLNHRQSGAISEKDFQDSYSITKLQSDNILHSSKNYLIKKYKPNKICNYNIMKLSMNKLKYFNFLINIYIGMIDFFFSRFPFFYWIIKYNLRENLLKDFITGLKVS